MKKQLLLLSLLASSILASSQTVNIPDSLFKSLLVGNTSINTNGDSDIQISEAEAYKSTLYTGSKKIEDLTGIEAFINLTGLSCYGNKLTSLDVSKNTKLRTLRCYINQLTTLDLSKNLDLEALACHRNQLSTLDVSKNTKLKELTCGSIGLTSLDISNNPDLEELDCSHNKLTELNIPFPAKLKVLDISGVDSLADMNFSVFTNLEELGCTSLELDELDISVLPKLTILDCSYNYLTSLDVSQHPNMTRLSCGRNEITELNVSNLPRLNSLYTSNNKLKTLDVSKNVILKYFRCGDNDLTELNIANGNNRNIKTIYADGCPDLTCIQVDSKSYADSNWTIIDSTASFSEDCGYANVHNPTYTEVSVYPNPATNYIHSDAFINSKIEISSLLGKTEFSKTSTTKSLDISQLPRGTYYLKIESDGEFSYAKFLKQ